MIKKILSVLISDIFLLLRKICGCNVAFKMVSIVSPCASLKTKEKGSILIGHKTGIRPGTEVSATHAEISIGNNCYINRNCMVVAHEKITLEDNVTIGPGTYIYDHDHDGGGYFVTRPIKIESGVWIGSNVIILKGVTIGVNSIIAAGSIITKDVAPNTLIVQKRVSSEFSRGD